MRRVLDQYDCCQYGAKYLTKLWQTDDFRKKRNTIVALEVIKQYIEENKIVCFISLDIKNAFNSIKPNDVSKIMTTYKTPTSIIIKFHYYLDNRKNI